MRSTITKMVTASTRKIDMYYRIIGSIDAQYGIVDGVDVLDDRISFLAGRLIIEALPSPMRFNVNHPLGTTPAHFLRHTIPVVSKLFLETLTAAGADNMQVFPAILENPTTGQTWSDFFAFNVVGLVDAIDPAGSLSTEVMPGDSGGVPPLRDFQKVVLSAAKARDLPMFRLLQNPIDIFVAARIWDYMRAHKPANSRWGVSSFEVQAS
jgi:hypothetical protein